MAAGIGGEWLLYGWSDLHWIADLAAGWALIGSGLALSRTRSESAVGTLVTAAGFAWFVPNFQSTGVGAIDWLAAHALYLHRGPLLHAVLSAPSGRLRGRIEAVAVAGAYGAALVTPVWRSGEATIALAALLAVIAYGRCRGSIGRERIGRVAAAWVATGLAAVLCGAAAARLAAPSGTADSATLLVYQLAIAALAIALFAGLRTSDKANVTDLVVELGDARSANLRGALRRALGDPTLDVGFWAPELTAYVDAAGRVLEIRPERRTTPIERDGEPVAVLVHDAAVLDDPALLEAVASAARLAAANARLQASVRAQVAELEASRRRVVGAADEERSRLERRLREGAERTLESLREPLVRARALAAPPARAAIQRAEARLERTLVELRELAAGLYPRVLAQEGLAGAVVALADRGALEVEVDVIADRLPPDIEAAAYFVCSEALANVDKHAEASHAVVTVTVSGGAVSVEIADDGRGGADPARGSGLRGLADRVEAIGGTLRVESPPGQGTRLIASLPLD